MCGWFRAVTVFDGQANAVAFWLEISFPLYINLHQYSWYTGTLYWEHEEIFCVHIDKCCKPLKLGYLYRKVWCNVSILDNSDQFISSDNSHTSAKFSSSGMLCRGADKSLAWPGRNKLQRQKILMFIYPIYYHNWRNISAIYIYITRLASNEIFSPSNKIHREVGQAKDLSAPWYCFNW
jgi:hypothetical protein